MRENSRPCHSGSPALAIGWFLWDITSSRGISAFLIGWWFRRFAIRHHSCLHCCLNMAKRGRSVCFLFFCLVFIVVVVQHMTPYTPDTISFKGHRDTAGFSTSVSPYSNIDILVIWYYNRENLKAHLFNYIIKVNCDGLRHVYLDCLVSLNCQFVP